MIILYMKVYMIVDVLCISDYDYTYISFYSYIYFFNLYIHIYVYVHIYNRNLTSYIIKDHYIYFHYHKKQDG